MCGIAGIVGPGAEAHRDRVDAMLAALVHRGPDDVGTWVGEGAVLGARRLAIVDVAHGHQPIVDSAAGRVLVANGEIYGFERIRRAHPDHPYGSGSDLEVVHPVVRRHGDRFLEHLPGTFALALWDAGTRELLLARDRFGERPLHWAEVGDLLVFASEPQALLASGLVARSVDREVLAEVIRQGYVPPDRSIWSTIRTLPPASRLRRRLGGRARVERWWEPPSVVEPSGGLADPVAWLRTELDRAVQDQLVADVPVGTFLSGGIDSSTVSALAARHHPRIAGFAFDMPVDSELPYAQAVADRAGIDLHVLRPDGVDLVEALHDVARTWGEPLGDSSTVPTLLLSRFVRGHVTVALTGDGADELLGGYLVWARRLLRPDDPIRGLAELRRGWRRHLPVRRSPRGSSVARRYAGFRSYIEPEALVALGLPPRSPELVDVSRYRADGADDVSRFDLDHYLPGDILVKTDRASMAVGLEVRAPFLDRTVAEGCLRLPFRWKADEQREKLLLREAFGDLLPPEVLARPKQGFGSPMARWLREPAVVQLLHDELADPRAPIAELLDPAELATYADGTDQLTWNLLTVALWWRTHGTASASASPSR